MQEQIYNPSDTICAISTPPGIGGIAVIRLSGADSIAIADSVWRGKPLKLAESHTAHLGNIVDMEGNIVDQALATVFKAPHSYTGDDTVEFSVHGSRWIQRKLLEILCHHGARLALRGEFTRRAYAAGNLDLAQAEGVADLIAASSKSAHAAALSQMRGGISHKLEDLRKRLLHLASLLELELDFSDQDVEFVSRKELIALSEEIGGEIERLHRSFSTGAAIKEGFPVAIVGPVNAGKSRLLNAILNEDRAIVSNIPGTTRDIVEDRCEVGEYLIRFLDTAGIRHTQDPIERIGIERSRLAASDAAVLLYVIDASAVDNSAGFETEWIEEYKEKTIVVINKTDIAPADFLRTKYAGSGYAVVAVSAATGAGIEHLIKVIGLHITEKVGNTNAEDIFITASRHAEALRLAGESIKEVIDSLKDSNITTDLVAHYLRQTIHHLSSITGSITTPQILDNIFKSFCVGK